MNLKLAVSALFAIVLTACGGPTDPWEMGFANRLCPVQGGEVVTDNPALVVNHDGQRIGFCCPGCPETFRANPEKFMEVLRSEAEIYGYRHPGS